MLARKQIKMKLSLLSLSAFLLPALAVDLPSLPASIEIDILFPRNSTYKQVDNFPVIFALQNAALAWDFGFQLWWEIVNITQGQPSTSSSTVDFESILQGDSPKVLAPADTVYIVNSTTDLGGGYYPALGTYQLSWGFKLGSNCTKSGSDFINITIGAELVGGNDIVFTVADSGKDIDLLAGGSCPIAGDVVGITSNLTRLGCAHVDNSGFAAEPCNINIDASLASSLSAQLPPIAVRTTTSRTSTSTTAASRTAVTGTTTSSSSTTTATGNSAPNNGNSQAAAAILAGVAGFCAFLA